MDGVVADFYGRILELDPDYKQGDYARVDKIVHANPFFFQELKPIEGAIEAVNELWGKYEIYFLSTPMWHEPTSYMDKRIWLERTFGEKAFKRLILTHRKDLNIGDYLIDDTTKNGAGEFKGLHIHFGTEKWPNWKNVCKFLVYVWSVELLSKGVF